MNPSYVKPDPATIFKAVQQHYGEPHWPTPRDPAGRLNERFWAAIYRNEHDMLFEPRENQFYEYQNGIYYPLTVHLILDRLGERMCEVAGTHSYPHLVKLSGHRHLSGVVARLKGQTQKEEAFENLAGFVHVANGVLDLNGGSVKLLPFFAATYQPEPDSDRLRCQSEVSPFQKGFVGIIGSGGQLGLSGYQIGGDEGYGHQLMDRMAEEGYYLKRVNNGSPASKPNLYANLSAEWWSVVGELIEHRKIVLLDADEKLVAQLTSRRKLYDSKGRERLESKADMRAIGVESPDRADALVGAVMLNRPGQSGVITARELAGITFGGVRRLFGSEAVSFDGEDD